MGKSRFTEAQIIGMIKEQEAGLPTAELCRKHGLERVATVAIEVSQVERIVIP
jgi:putative transposase